MRPPYNDILADQIAPAATVEENLELYKRVASGDKAARQEMIERNMALVLSRVDAFVKTHPNVKYLWDDLVSAGSLGLTKTVDAMVTGLSNDDSPTGYMSQGITCAMIDMLEPEATITVSRRTLHRIEENGGTDPCLERVEAVNLDTCSTGESTPGLVELRDLLDSCCESDVDRDILRLKEQGYTFREMAEALNIPRTTISDAFQRIYERFRLKESCDGVSRSVSQLRFN